MQRPEAGLLSFIKHRVSVQQGGKWTWEKGRGASARHTATLKHKK